MRPGLVLVLLAGALASAPAASAGCGGRHHASASRPRTPGQRAALLVGDSTSIYALAHLARRRLEADAQGCRQVAAGTRLIAARRRAGTLPHLVVVALGTNGGVSPGAIRRLLSTVGPTRVLALVTPRNHASGGQAMRAAARRHPDRVLLIDWRRYSSGRRGVFAGDGLHPTPSGARVFAAYIARRAAPVIKPPSRSLRLPAHRAGTKDCGVQRRFGRTLAVRVVAGRDRIACARARQLARRPPLQGIPGWAWADWTPLPGPWIDAYRRCDRRVVVATAPVAHALRPG